MLTCTQAMLMPNDFLAISAFNDSSKLILDATRVGPDILPLTQKAVARIAAGGNTTNLAEGWLRAARAISPLAEKHMVTRCLILTDGQVNCGATDPQHLTMHARELHLRSISTSAFGIGEDFNQDLLTSLADHGGGTYAYISSPHLLQRALQREFQATTCVTARLIRIGLQACPGMQVHVHGGFETTLSQNKLLVPLPDLCNGQVFHLALTVTMSAMNAQPQRLVVELEWQQENGTMTQNGDLLEWKAASQAEVAAEPINQEVSDLVGTMLSDEGRLAALKAHQAGDHQRASRLMASTSQSLDQLLDSDHIRTIRDQTMKLRDELEQDLDTRRTHQLWDDSYNRTRQTTTRPGSNFRFP